MIKPDATIVIVEYHSENEIHTLLQSLKTFEPDVPVIISSNSCYGGDELSKLAKRYHGVTVLKNKINGGYSYAANRALEIVNTEYVIILNPDVEIISPILDVASKMFEAHPSLACFTPFVLDSEGHDTTVAKRFWLPKFACARFMSALNFKGRIEKIHNYYLRAEWSHDRFQAVDSCSGGVMFLRRSALNSIGGFDERYFMYMEDVDLCRRFWENGWIVAFVPDIKVIHRAHYDSVRNILDIRRLFCRTRRAHLASYVKYYLKWGGRPYFPSDKWNRDNNITPDVLGE